MHVRLSVRGLAKIPGLTIDPSAEVLRVLKPRPASYVIIRGQFTGEDTSVALSHHVVRPGRDGRFAVRIPIRETEGNTVEIRSVDFLGRVRTPRVTVTVPRLIARAGPGSGASQPSKLFVDAGAKSNPVLTRRPRSTGPARVLPPEYRFAAELGITQLNLTEQGALAYSEKAAGLRLSYAMARGLWGFGASTNLTLAPFGETGSNLSTRLFEIETYGSYFVPRFHSPWSLGIRAGAYYATTEVSGDAFGFHNFLSPEIYPVLSYTFSNEGVVSGTFRYAPVVDQQKGLTFSDHSLQAGLAYGHGHWLVSGEYRRLEIDDSGPGSVRLNAFMISAGLRF